MTPAPALPLTVDYDASCPLCRAEMEAMKARDARDVLRLVDCSSPGFDAVYGAAGYGRAARVYASPLLRRLQDRVYPWIADHRYLLSRLSLPRLFRMPAMASGAACPVAQRAPSVRRDAPC